MDALEDASRLVFNVIVFVISKITIFFWSIFRLIGRVFGYPRVERLRRRRPRDNDFARYEQNSVFLGSIHLFHYETSEESFVYGHFHNEDWDTIIKGVLRENKANGTNDFYLYTDNPENEMTEGMRMPAPITVSFLQNTLRSEDE